MWKGPGALVSICLGVGSLAWVVVSTGWSQIAEGEPCSRVLMSLQQPVGHGCGTLGHRWHGWISTLGGGLWLWVWEVEQGNSRSGGGGETSQEAAHPVTMPGKACVQCVCRSPTDVSSMIPRY